MARKTASMGGDLASTVGQLTIVRGVVTVLFGIFALIWPGLTLVTLGILLAIWLLVGGVTGIVSAVLVRDGSTNWVLKLLVSMLELGIGAYLVQRPGLSVATVVTLVAIVLIVEGVVDVIGAFVDKSSAGSKILPIFGGLIGVVAGILIWQYPVTGGLAFVWVLGLYAVIFGSLTIAVGVDVAKE